MLGRVARVLEQTTVGGDGRGEVPERVLLQIGDAQEERRPRLPILEPFAARPQDVDQPLGVAALGVQGLQGLGRRGAGARAGDVQIQNPAPGGGGRRAILELVLTEPGRPLEQIGHAGDVRPVSSVRQGVVQLTQLLPAPEHPGQALRLGQG